MEWIIIIVVIIFIFSFFTSNASRDYAIKDAIQRAYVANKNGVNEWVYTPIHWNAAVKYANKHGIDMHQRDDEDKSFHVDTIISEETISVLFMRNPKDGKAMVRVW